MTWVVEQRKKPKLTNPILIEGLPGIGNVGKVAIDFLIEELKAVKIAKFTSEDESINVFVNENNLIEIPVMEVYHKKVGKRDILFLTGDIQPNNEKSCAQFVKAVLDFAKQLGVKQVITTGGIGLPEVPEEPKAYCTGTDKKSVSEFVKGTDAKTDLFGIVGPIIGVTGILAALAPKYGMIGLCVLAETYGNPAFIGVDGSKKILYVFKKKFSLSIDPEAIDADLEALEEEVLERVKQMPQLKALEDQSQTYIG